MTRLYLKIFFSFWLVMALMIVATILVVYWFDLTPEKNFIGHNRDRLSAPAKQLLNQAVGASINNSRPQAMQGLKSMPLWASRHIYVIDQQGHDLISRPVPPAIKVFALKINHDRPYAKSLRSKRLLFGRYIQLADGTPVRIVTLGRKGPNDEGNILWQLFLQNIWPLLLVSILISGSACLFLAKRMARGLQTLKNATRKIARGDLSVRISNQFAGQGEEINALADDFDHMTARLEKAMLEQKRLIKDVSHELRSPLARLQIALGLAQLRSRGTVDSELERIKEAADYLNNVISDILSMPVHDDGGWDLHDTLDLKSLLETLVHNCEQDANNKKVTLKLALPMGECLVASRGNTLIGVFENVLRNALHYTPEESSIDITLSRLNSNKLSCIDIRDRGMGVDSALLEDIFQPFFRTSEARDRSSGGHGLGLAIAARTTSLHGGDITASNHSEGGLCVCITLPSLNLS
jgi:two-component system sensor histidine kinase CpxA|tara:strand:- start:2052 stop:3449 length:1398 start_codon:yes stop_codon:yes gene_type:complete